MMTGRLENASGTHPPAWRFYGGHWALPWANRLKSLKYTTGSITFLVNGTLQRPPTRPKDGTRAFRAGWACIELIQSAPVRVPLLQTSENRAVRRASVFCPVSCGSRSRVHRATGTLATRAQGHLRPPLDPGRRPSPSQCQEHACFARWGSEKATLAGGCRHVGKRREAWSSARGVLAAAPQTRTQSHKIRSKLFGGVVARELASRTSQSRHQEEVGGGGAQP